VIITFENSWRSWSSTSPDIEILFVDLELVKYKLKIKKIIFKYNHV